MQNFTRYENNYLGQETLSVYQTAVYFSSKTRKILGLKNGNCISFFIEKDKGIIAMKVVAEHKKGESYVLDKGYCGLLIGNQMPKGRYFYQGVENGLFIFKQ